MKRLAPILALAALGLAACTPAQVAAVQHAGRTTTVPGATPTTSISIGTAMSKADPTLRWECPVPGGFWVTTNDEGRNELPASLRAECRPLAHPVKVG